MKKKKIVKSKNILVNFVLDETGSMQSCIEATISGFNEYVNGLKKDKKNKYLFTLTQWDSSRFNVIHNAVDISKVKNLTNETYRPGASTPLYDAIAKTIKAVEDNVKKGTHVLTVIMTDGAENASKEYSHEAVKSLIKAKEKLGWTFVFLAANIDAKKTAVGFGMSIDNAMRYDTNKTLGAMAALAANTKSYAAAPRGSGMSCNAFFVDTKDYDESKEDKKIKL